MLTVSGQSVGDELRALMHEGAKDSEEVLVTSTLGECFKRAEKCQTNLVVAWPFSKKFFRYFCEKGLRCETLDIQGQTVIRLSGWAEPGATDQAAAIRARYKTAIAEMLNEVEKEVVFIRSRCRTLARQGLRTLNVPIMTQPGQWGWPILAPASDALFRALSKWEDLTVTVQTSAIHIEW